MIIDRIERLPRYFSLHPRIETAFQWLRSNNVCAITPGYYSIQGEDIKVKIQRYTTVPTPERKIEVHSRYMDIQCMIRGNERFGYLPPERIEQPGIYDLERDIAFPDGTCDYLTLAEGSFFIAFPGEAHQTKCMRNRPEQVVKAILKIRVQD